jgi:photosystem II stability/assembly factor-like uncharacterized protein
MKRMLIWVLALTAGEYWTVQTSGIDSNLRGVSIARNKTTGSSTTIWASGSKGVILRSNDGGRNWEQLRIPDGETLDYRGVQAFDGNTAYIMASGEGEKSRIYKTTDGGKNWEMQYTNKNKEFFLDGIACISATNCFAISDPVDGRFLLLRTDDGKTWKELPGDGMPAAMEKEGVFAASNSSLLIYEGREIYFATGGPAARVFHSPDLGKNWRVTKTPMVSGKAPQGIFSLTRSGDTVVAVGGDYEKPEQTEGAAAYSLDQGKTWTLAAKLPGGYRSAVTNKGTGFVAVGPNGTDISNDGVTWVSAGKISLNAVGFVDEEGWAVGAKGTIGHSSAQDTN